MGNMTTHSSKSGSDPISDLRTHPYNRPWSEADISQLGVDFPCGCGQRHATVPSARIIRLSLPLGEDSELWYLECALAHAIIHASA